MEESIVGDPALEASAAVNTPENVRLTFDQVVMDRLQELVETHFQFYKQVMDDEGARRYLFDRLFDRYITGSTLPSGA